MHSTIGCALLSLLQLLLRIQGSRNSETAGRRLPGENPDREGVALLFMIPKLRIVVNLFVALVLIIVRKSAS